MSRVLTVDEYAAKHDVSNNEAKRRLKKYKSHLQTFNTRGTPVAGVHKHNASSPRTK